MSAGEWGWYAITRPEGQAFLFNLVGGVWTPEVDVTERLERLTDAAGLLIGWRYTTNTDETERYDREGRLVSITNRQGFAQTLAYDAEGRLATVTDPAGRTLGFTCDANGFVASRTDFNGHTTRYSHDARGLEASRIEAAGTPEERTVTTTWHPSLRVPISITEPGKEITFTYDAAARLLGRRPLHLRCLEPTIGHRLS